MEAGITNAMSVDVEDYFQVSAFEPHIQRASWDEYPRRVMENTERVLELFDEAGVKATFFVLGWVAERHPELVERIVGQGHELGSHGYSHVLATAQKPEEFYQDVMRTKNILEDIGGCRVRGYRAASYSISRTNQWAFGVLEEAGYEYSSSVYPIRHDLYGMPEAPRFPYCPNESGLLEIPITTLVIMNKRLPCGGGGFFRLFPYGLSRWAIRRVNTKDKRPSIFYFHPWEIDPDQPKQPGLGVKTRVRHYLNLTRMEGRLQRLLRDFSWSRMDSVFLSSDTDAAADEKAT